MTLLLILGAATLLVVALLWAAHRAPVSELDESMTRADAPTPRPYRHAA